MYDINDLDFKNDLNQNRIKFLINNYGYSLESLSHLTHVPEEFLKRYMSDKNVINELSENDSRFLSETILLLKESFNIENDDRLKLLLSMYLNEYNVSLNTISLYSGVEENKILNYQHNIDDLSFSDKYKLSMVVMMLHFIVKYPDYNKTL